MKAKGADEQEEKPKRVFLADHYSIIRVAVAEWLNRTADLAVCGQADNAPDALKSIRRLKPDIVVTEIFGQQDCKFIQTLHKQHPSLPILVFSYGNEKWFTPRALQAGADGFMLKGVSANGLVDGIRRTLQKRVVFRPNFPSRLLMKCPRPKMAPAPARKKASRRRC